MFLQPARSSLHTSLRGLHLALQLLVGYWALRLDSTTCLTSNLTIVTYIAYGQLALNLIYILFRSNRFTVSSNKYSYYLPLAVNLVIAAVMLYFVIVGHQQGNVCAAGRLLYEFDFIEIVVAVVLSLALYMANMRWAEKYANWPGNIAWPVLILKTQPVPPLLLALGIIYAVISASSLLVTALCYNTVTLDLGNSGKYLRIQWWVSMAAVVACQIGAMVLLITGGLGGGDEYRSEYVRKVLVVFVGVNVVDALMWGYGYWRVSRPENEISV